MTVKKKNLDELWKTENAKISTSAVDGSHLFERNLFRRKLKTRKNLLIENLSFKRAIK